MQKRIGYVEQNEEIKSTKSDAKSIAFTILGIFFIGEAIPKTSSLIYFIIASKSDSEYQYYKYSMIYDLIGGIIQLTFGICLVIGTEKIYSWFNKLRKAGVNNLIKFDS